jgi:hypothetical protein
VKSQRFSMGIVEARFGLALVIFMLLLLGYVTLQQLGGTGDLPPVEFRTSQLPTAIEDSRPPVAGNVETLQVLTPQGDDPMEQFRVSDRPDWGAPIFDPNKVRSFGGDPSTAAPDRKLNDQ